MVGFSLDYQPSVYIVLVALFCPSRKPNRTFHKLVASYNPSIGVFSTNKKSVDPRILMHFKSSKYSARRVFPRFSWALKWWMMIWHALKARTFFGFHKCSLIWPRKNIRAHFFHLSLYNWISLSPTGSPITPLPTTGAQPTSRGSVSARNQWNSGTRTSRSARDRDSGRGPTKTGTGFSPFWSWSLL